MLRHVIIASHCTRSHIYRKHIVCVCHYWWWLLLEGSRWVLGLLCCTAACACSSKAPRSRSSNSLFSRGVIVGCGLLCSLHPPPPNIHIWLAVSSLHYIMLTSTQEKHVKPIIIIIMPYIFLYIYIYYLLFLCRRTSTAIRSNRSSLGKLATCYHGEQREIAGKKNCLLKTTLSFFLSLSFLSLAYLCNIRLQQRGNIKAIRVDSQVVGRAHIEVRKPRVSPIFEQTLGTLIVALHNHHTDRAGI